MGTNKFENWADYILDEKDEFYYRYIYDAYVVVKAATSGYYYELRSENNDIILFNQFTKKTELVFVNEEEKLFFLNYLFTRFCGNDYNSIKDWHATMHQWHGDDLKNWDN